MKVQESEKRTLIAECFKKHFEHFGYKKTTVDNIANELEISKKTIYNFFDTKEEIYYFVISKIAQKIAADMWNRLNKHRTAKEKLVELIQMIFQESRKWLRENDAFEFKYKYEIAEIAFKEAHGKLVKKIIEEGIDKGEFENRDSSLVETFIKGIISASMRLLSANPDLMVEEETIKSVIKLVTI